MPARDRPRQPRPWASVVSPLARATAATIGPVLALGHRPMLARHRHHPKLGHLLQGPGPALGPARVPGPVQELAPVPVLVPQSVAAAAAVAQP